MGVIGGMPRGPKFPPRSRRANARAALTSSDQIRVTGKMTNPVVSPTTMPANPEDGETVLLYDSTGPEVSIAIHYGGLWYKAVATAIT